MLNARVTVIAEVGSNFGGDFETAKAYISAAAEAGADAVKFQTLERDHLVSPVCEIDGTWVNNPVYQNFANIGLPPEWHRPLLEHAQGAGIEFLSTPFHLEAVDLLEEVGVSRYKIASGDLTFVPLLKRIGQTHKPVILSTGASSLDEVQAAVQTLTDAGSSDITLLHCVALYPPEMEEMNLRALDTLHRGTGLPVGLSDHTRGSVAPLLALAMGASVFERHVTFDRTLDGPDHPYATTFDELAKLIADLQLGVAALGHGRKEPAAREQERRHRFRRSPYERDVDMGPSPIWLRPER